MRTHSRGHAMSSQRLADEICKNVSRPNQQKQKEKKKGASPLLAQLNQRRHRQRDVNESKCRDHRRRKSGCELPAMHCDAQENKRRQYGSAQREVCETGSRERISGSGMNRHHQKEKPTKYVSGNAQRTNAIRLRKLQQLMNGE